MTPVYGVDIETAPPGLDPRVAQITAIAAAGPNGVFVATSDTPDTEFAMIDGFTGWLAQQPQGIVATWNGSAFDLPYIVDRALVSDDHYDTYGPIRLAPSADRPAKYDPLPGHAGGYLAAVSGHDHVDIAHPYRPIVEDAGVKWSLKPTARHAGLDPVDPPDRANAGVLPVTDRIAYVLSDATITRDLAVALDADQFDVARDRLLLRTARL